MDTDRRTNETSGGCRCVAAIGADGYDIDGAVGYDYGCPHPQCHNLGGSVVEAIAASIAERLRQRLDEYAAHDISVAGEDVALTLDGVPRLSLAAVSAVAANAVVAVVDGLCAGSNQGD
ncbi:MAG: hypothetical protein ABIJ75_07895 [Actinomycetota bacterium]